MTSTIDNYDFDIAEVGDVIEYECEKLDWHFTGKINSMGSGAVGPMAALVETHDIIDGEDHNWFTVRYSDDFIDSDEYTVELLGWNDD